MKKCSICSELFDSSDGTTGYADDVEVFTCYGCSVNTLLNDQWKEDMVKHSSNYLKSQKYFRSQNEISISECEEIGKITGEVGVTIILIILIIFHLFKGGIFSDPLTANIVIMFSYICAPLAQLLLVFPAKWLGGGTGEFSGGILGVIGVILQNLLNNKMPQIIPVVLVIIGAVLGWIYDGILFKLPAMLLFRIIDGAFSSGIEAYKNTFGNILIIGLVATGAIIGFSIGLKAIPEKQKPEKRQVAPNQWWDGSEK